MPKLSLLFPRRPRLLFSLLFSGTLLFSAFLTPRVTVRAAEPAHTITWDSHSLLLDGHRLLLYSGEFHYFRLPSQSQWLDRLEKIRAAGLNAISVYFDWQYHSSAPGQYDFTGVRDIDALLNMARQIGLYVIARVGPYMNAEVDAGGLPGWLLSKQLFLRSQTWDGKLAHPQFSALYDQYSKEWYDHLLPILSRHQVTNNGPVVLLSIENEYPQDTGSAEYMQDLYGYARQDGIQVPIFHNDFYFRGDWSKLVDLYAYDSYPYGFVCCHQWWDTHFHGIDTWEQQLRVQLNIKTPMFVSELQGGSYDGWGGKGYGALAKTLDGNWLTALDESAFAQGAGILNTYMYAGGTSWGYMGEPNVYSSYDYGAPISESGGLRGSYYASHRLASFLQTYGPSLAGANAAPSLARVSNPKVMIHSRLNPDNGQGFIFLRHGDAGKAVTTKLATNLQGRAVQIPQKPNWQITMPGHSATILTQNVDTGPLHLNYSTSQVFTDANTSGGHYLVLFGPRGSTGETDFALPSGTVSIQHNLGVQVSEKNGELRLDYHHTTEPRTVSIQTPSGTLRLLITTTAAASKYWVDNHMLIAGPDLVTNDNGNLKISDSQRRDVRVYGASPDTSLRVDGRLTALPDAFMGSTLLGKLQGGTTASLPALKTWKFSPASPEISPTFDDSSWALANHSTTNNPNVPATTSLLADDYGFHYGFVWYRGHFQGAGTETGILLDARQSYSVYLNGQYVGSKDTNLADPPHTYATPQLFAFPAGAVHSGQDNVVSVLTESLGHDEGWVAGPAAQSPQGLISAQLQGSVAAVSWRLQGDQGGEQSSDPLRGLQNASGLYGERQGWYLPQFDDISWQNVSTPDSWKARPVSDAVGWYRTHFQLQSPAGTTSALGLRLKHVGDKAVIWLNGWLIGRYWEQKGPQHDFYLPQGVLNPSGDNVLSIGVWNRGHDGGLASTPELFRYSSSTSHDLQASSVDASGLDYWHTSGNRIVDSQGRPVRIAAVNWSGMQQFRYVPDGLDHQPLDAILTQIRQFGFNTIRLPFSNQLVEQNPIVTVGVEANPDLKGLHALDIMDAIVQAAQNHGLRIILDDQRSTIGTDPQENGLWYTKQYPESSWIRDWQTLVARYNGNPTVVGVDLRDEPHTAGPGPWSVKTYLHQGATWGAYKGIENPATDWRLGAQRGGDAVLAANPHLLVFVEGLQQYPDPSQPGGIDSYWWGGIFQPAAQFPMALSTPHQLVYSPHEYGPLKWEMPFFGPHMTYKSISANWARHWQFLERASYSQQAPLFIGEFGTCGTSLRCIQDTAPGSQGLWFQFLMRYFKDHPEIGWSFWAVNGTNHRNHPSTSYVFSKTWTSPHLPALIQTLRDVEAPPPPSS